MQDVKSGETFFNQEDFSWLVFSAHWFLIGIAAFISTIIKIDGLPNGEDLIFYSFFGGLIAIAFLSLIPLAIGYLVSKNKGKFRAKRIFTISGWCCIGFVFYPILTHSI
ncbi:MAG: hypothetical protein Q7U42_02065 [Parvibaculum sp.]|nr:hypothetical protein [Parvibaculum sp.]